MGPQAGDRTLNMPVFGYTPDHNSSPGEVETSGSRSLVYTGEPV